MKKLFVIIMLLVSYGFTFAADRLFYEGFESGTLNNVQKTAGVTVSKVDPKSGIYCARVQYGPEEGNQNIIKRLTSGISNEFYVKFWMKLDSEHWFGDQPVKPFRANYNYSGSSLTIWAGNGCVGWISGQMNTLDGMFQRTINTAIKVSDSVVAPYWLGNWAKIELYVKKNSAIGVYDGIYKLWWNGKLVYNDNTMHPSTADGKFYDTFYFPSNSGCDKYKLSSCCDKSWDQVTPFYAYVDEIEVWNGMPGNAGTSDSQVQSPSNLKIK